MSVGAEVQITLSGGAQGALTGFDGKILAVRLPLALAPGQPAELTVASEPPLALAGRSIGSRRREDGSFDVRLRLVNLTREAREALLAAATAND